MAGQNPGEFSSIGWPFFDSWPLEALLKVKSCLRCWTAIYIAPGGVLMNPPNFYVLPCFGSGEKLEPGP